MTESIDPIGFIRDGDPGDKKKAFVVSVERRDSWCKPVYVRPPAVSADTVERLRKMLSDFPLELNHYEMGQRDMLIDVIEMIQEAK